MFDINRMIENYAKRMTDEALKEVYNSINRKIENVGKADDTPLSVLQDIRHEVGMMRVKYTTVDRL